MTFADLLMPTHPERKCYVNFFCISATRIPSIEEEDLKNPDVFLIYEPQIFFYRPFKIKDLKIC